MGRGGRQQQHSSRKLPDSSKELHDFLHLLYGPRWLASLRDALLQPVTHCALRNLLLSKTPATSLAAGAMQEWFTAPGIACYRCAGLVWRGGPNPSELQVHADPRNDCTSVIAPPRARGRRGRGGPPLNPNPVPPQHPKPHTPVQSLCSSYQSMQAVCAIARSLNPQTPFRCTRRRLNDVGPYDPPPREPGTGLCCYYWLDFGSILPVLLLQAGPGCTVLDMCAAPGAPAPHLHA